METKEKVLTAAQFLRKHYIKTAIFVSKKIFDLNSFLPFSPLYNLTPFKQLNNPNIYVCNNKFLIVFLTDDNVCELMKMLGSINIRFFISINLADDKNLIEDKQIFIIKKVLTETGIEALNGHSFVKTSSKINNFAIDYLANQGLQVSGTIGWTKETLTNTSPLVVLKNISEGAICVNQNCEALTILAKTKNYEFSEVVCTAHYFDNASIIGTCFILLTAANEFVNKIASKKRIRIRRKVKKTIEN